MRSLSGGVCGCAWDCFVCAVVGDGEAEEYEMRRRFGDLSPSGDDIEVTARALNGGLGDCRALEVEKQ
jgi:hypothetical protein